MFPKGPAHAGEFDLNGKEVTLKLLPESHATIAGKPVTDAKLDPDTSEHVTRVEMGTLALSRHCARRPRGSSRARYRQCGRAQFQGNDVFPARHELPRNGDLDSLGRQEDSRSSQRAGRRHLGSSAGNRVFKVNGQELRLTAIGGDSKTGLFFVFNDLTLKSDTYPGGRFLDTGPIVDGHVVLDFNRAYNPPCAVTPYATCPLAPKENRLAIAIPAGRSSTRLRMPITRAF